jgi:hypothetical protein
MVVVVGMLQMVEAIAGFTPPSAHPLEKLRNNNVSCRLRLRIIISHPPLAPWGYARPIERAKLSRNQASDIMEKVTNVPE